MPAKPSEKILKILKRNYPDVECALNHETPLQLMVATILSAQCTDKRVNIVTQTLFKKYKTAKDFAEASIPELEKEIRSTGFYRQKAKWIHQACKIVQEKYHGKLPETLEELMTLPGVARKTANVVMGTAFKVASGVVVDTHVKRIAKKLGLTKQEDPVKVEQDLVKIIPRKDWIWFSHAIITHGRQICKAIHPQCPVCPLNEICPASQV